MENLADASGGSKKLECSGKSNYLQEGKTYGGESAPPFALSDGDGDPLLRRPWSYGGTASDAVTDQVTRQQLDEFEEVINRMASMTKSGPPLYPCRGSEQSTASHVLNENPNRTDEKNNNTIRNLQEHKEMSNQRYQLTEQETSDRQQHNDHAQNQYRELNQKQELQHQQQQVYKYHHTHPQQYHHNHNLHQQQKNYDEQQPLHDSLYHLQLLQGNQQATAWVSSTRHTEGPQQQCQQQHQHQCHHQQYTTSQYEQLCHPQQPQPPYATDTSLRCCPTSTSSSVVAVASASSGRAPATLSPRPSPYPSPLTSPNPETPPSSNHSSRRSSLSRLHQQVPVSPVRIHVTAPWEPRTRPLHVNP